MTLFFDTETSGFYNKKEPPSHSSQPHLVQFAAILDDEEGNIKAKMNCRVNPGLTEEIPEGARNVHGIDRAEVEAFGIPLKVVCSIFSNLRKLSSRLVAHNIEFDMGVMSVQFSRIEKDFDIVEGVFCTHVSAHIILARPKALLKISAE